MGIGGFGEYRALLYAGHIKFCLQVDFLLSKAIQRVLNSIRRTKLSIYCETLFLVVNCPADVFKNDFSSNVILAREKTSRTNGGQGPPLYCCAGVIS